MCVCVCVCVRACMFRGREEMREIKQQIFDLKNVHHTHTHKHTHKARLDILRIHSRKMNLTRGINLRKIAETMPGASGAEIKVLIILF